VNDLDLIERLRAAGTNGPAPRTSPDAVLAAGRRAQARRNVLRISGATLSVAAIVLGGMQLTPGSGTQTVTAAGDGAPADGPAPALANPAPQSAGEIDPNADAVNAKILQTAMGNDFDVNADNPNGKLRPGTDSASALPTQYSAGVGLMADVSNTAGLKDLCRGFEEKGSTFADCVTRTLPDGTEVQAQFSHWAPTAQYPQETAGQVVRVMYLQANGVLVRVDLTASTHADDTTDSSDAATKKWLDSMVDRLGAAAINPAVEAEGFDGDHCDTPGDTWTCDPADAAPTAKPADPDQKAREAKKDAAGDTKAMDAKKAAAAEEKTYADKPAAGKEAPEAAPADEKALAAKKAAIAESEAMDAKKATAAQECADSDRC
jgi:hypothetical protein